jgi:CP family cyanate transporter-like MFS transporter
MFNLTGGSPAPIPSKLFLSLLVIIPCTHHEENAIRIAKKEHILYNLKQQRNTPLNKPNEKFFNEGRDNAATGLGGRLRLGRLPDHIPWLILGCVWLVALFLYILMQCISPLLPILIVDFELNHSTGGFLYSLPVLMIALFSYPLGILSDRIGVEIAVGCGATVAVLSSFMRPFSSSFYLFVLATAIFGLGFAIFFPNLPKLVKENFPQHLSATTTGLYTTAILLGSGLGMALTKPILAATGSWRKVLVIWSLMAIPIVVLWWVIARMSRKRKGRSGSEVLQKESFQDKSRWPLNDYQGDHYSHQLISSVLIAGLILSLLNLIFYSTIGWLPTYLTERGWDPVLAATATSVISFLEIPAVLLVPMLSDRTGRRRLIMISSFLLLAISSIAVSLSPSSIWFISPILGITFGGIFALLLSLPVELVKKEKVGRAAGAIISVGYIGALTGAPVTGYLRDLTGDFSFGFIVMGFVGLIAAGLSCMLPERRLFKRG